MNVNKEMYPSLTFTAVDIETTGLDPKHNNIIEIAAVKFRNNQIGKKFQSFINIGKPLPGFIKSLTRISDEDLINARSQKMVLSDFLDFIGEDILCFHNAMFDRNFINSALEQSSFLHLTNKIYDSLEIARIFTPHLKSHSLSSLCNSFNIQNDKFHRADIDAKVTGKLLVKLTKFICDNYEIGTIYKIAEIAELALLQSHLHEYLTVIHNFLTKTSLTRKKKKIDQNFFPLTNFISNLKKEPMPLNQFNENEILEFFENGGQLAKHFENYEYRQGQIDMTAWITEAYKDGRTLLIEAGTGIGKSLSYLIPSIFFSKFTQQRIIISTNTKNLQEQLFYKDIPAIQNFTDLIFTAALLKGRKNYLCLRKWNNIISDISGHLSSYEAKFCLNLIIWAEKTKTGDIEENHSFNPAQSSLWQKTSTDGNYCYGRKCSYYNKCFVMKIRQQAEKSNLVVVNHSLLLSDAVNENSVLGNYAHLVIDEAHNLPQTAAVHFGFSIKLFDLWNVSSKILTKGDFQYGIANNIKIAVVKSTISNEKKKVLKSMLNDFDEPIGNFEKISLDFFKIINQIVIENGSYGKLRFKNLSIFESSKELIEEINYSISQIFKNLNSINKELSDTNSNIFPFYDQNISDLEGLINQILELQNKFQHTFAPDFENYAFWLETSDKEFNSDHLPHCSIVCAPIEVNQSLYDFFWSRLETTILTSATIAIRDEFKFYKSLTGLNKIEENKLMEYIASSPFDYHKQMMVLIPDFLPNPQDKFFSSQAVSLLKEIISAHNRGTLVLFTSYKDLGFAFNALSDSISGQKTTLLAQGKTGTRTSILNTFRKDENSVLLGTRSFWEGVDVPGKSLEILILYRLPFLVPTEPLVEAYTEKLIKDGKNAFLYYILPISLLNFKQGFGRLIRNKTDKGVVVILDSRIFKKDYGKYFIKVMPLEPIKIDSNIELIDYINGWFEK